MGSNESPVQDRAVRRLALVALVAGLVAFAVYVATLDPTLPPGDSGDLITAASTLGVAHPPGYPLFAMVGHLFTLIPIGTPALRVNLMSAVFDALAVAGIAFLTYRIACEAPSERIGRINPTALAALAALAAGLFLAFSTGFWSYSLVAEVFALNNFFAALLLLLAYAWYRAPERRWLLWGFFLAAGLSVCNQQTIVLLGPGLAVLLFGGISRFRTSVGRSWVPKFIRVAAVGLVVLALGLLPYAYLPIAAAASPPAMWGDPSTLERFVAVVTRADYGSFSLIGGGQHGDLGANLGAFLGYLVEAFGVGGCLLAVAGVWWLARRRPIVGLALVTCVAVAGPLFLAYANPPLSGLLAGIFARFYILPSVPFAVLVGCGSFQALEWSGVVVARIRWTTGRRTPLVIAGLVASILVALSVGPAAARYPSVDQSNNRMTINFVRDLLSPLDKDAVLLTEGDTAVLGMWYAQNVEGYRPDVVVIAVPLLHLQWYIDQIRRQHPEITIPFEADEVAGQPVTARVLGANIAKRPVYYVGVIPEDFPSGYGELHTGFARKFVPAADGADPFAFTRTNIDKLESYAFPTKSYPVSSWENWEASYYGGAAFDLANAYEARNVATAEAWYRTAIELAPEIPGAYKNLAILLSANGGQRSEIADLLEAYLLRAPQDPEAATIRKSIEQLRASAP